MSYFEKLLSLGVSLEPGKFCHVAIRHDNNCRIWNGGACDCEAEIECLDGPPEIKPSALPKSKHD